MPGKHRNIGHNNVEEETSRLLRILRYPLCLARGWDHKKRPRRWTSLPRTRKKWDDCHFFLERGTQTALLDLLERGRFGYCELVTLLKHRRVRSPLVRSRLEAAMAAYTGSKSLERVLADPTSWKLADAALQISHAVQDGTLVQYLRGIAQSQCNTLLEQFEQYGVLTKIVVNELRVKLLPGITHVETVELDLTLLKEPVPA